MCPPMGRWGSVLDAAGRGAAGADGEFDAVRVVLQRGGTASGLEPHGPVPQEDEEACGQWDTCIIRK